MNTNTGENKKDGLKKPKTVKKRVMKLKCPLTDAELLALGSQMADANAELDDLAEEMETYKARHKSTVAEQDAIVSKCSDLIKAKYEHRDVQVEETKDWGTERVTQTRLDTKETFTDRPMTAQELGELPLEDNGEGNDE